MNFKLEASNASPKSHFEWGSILPKLPFFREISRHLGQNVPHFPFDGALFPIQLALSKPTGPLSQDTLSLGGSFFFGEEVFP